MKIGPDRNRDAVGGKGAEPATKIIFHKLVSIVF
jgi:hypothetical protein